ncbi:MBL fold metallo-hydrolase [Candidatus Bathyarchaeota archaeon]|nr:MAG: MBL fold metallo-hydrolase [Candidatus Bathyarchaeota archaeon]
MIRPGHGPVEAGDMPFPVLLRAGGISVQPVWFDSLGAKSSSFLVRTPDTSILVDPGAAAMQPSFPLPGEVKEELRLRALEAIGAASRKADYVVITHYHYDHHVRLDQWEGARAIYEGKVIWAKDPNSYINKSQWGRARLFYGQLCGELGGLSLEEVLEEPRRREFEDPVARLELARARDFGDYGARREELLSRGRKWFEKLSRDLWARGPWIPDLELGRTRVEFVDGREREVGHTLVRFPGPFFHGVEYDRVGWVFSLVVEVGGAKLLYSSDLQGPVIEDYAEWIISEDPDILILDGPPTYLLGYMLNRVNLSRAVENICRIIRSVGADPIILDHHLLRDPRYARRLAQVYEVARGAGKKVLTAAELMGEEPVALRVASGKMP